MPKIRNIIIFTAIAVALILIYIFFIKSPSDQPNLVTSSNTSLPDVGGTTSGANTMDKTSLVAKDFLTLLLNVKNIKLNDAIFSDQSFSSLRDSSITLTPDGTEGRPNPFAQFGNDAVPVTTPPPSNIPAPAQPASPQTNPAPAPLQNTQPKTNTPAKNTPAPAKP